MSYRRLFAAAVLAAPLFLPGCRYPKYASYRSFHGDFKCQVPYSWHVMRDAEGAHYANATFLGPFDPHFYLGVPSVSVRWYSHFRPHRLPDGILEMYSGPDDYIRQALSTVYGPKYLLDKPVQEIPLPKAGITAKYFVVQSPAPMPKANLWGASVDAATKEHVNMRMHAYVVVPMDGGFYVLVYPATRDGYPKFEKEFNTLVNTFRPLKHGPSGAAFAPPPGGSSAR